MTENESRLDVGEEVTETEVEVALTQRQRRLKSPKRKGSAFERKVASALGSKRMPLSGAVGGGDIMRAGLAESFSVECKARAKLPVSVTGPLAQATRDIGYGDPRMPLVVMQEDRGQAIAILWLDDLVKVLTDSEVQNASKVRDLLRSIQKLAAEAERLSR